MKALLLTLSLPVVVVTACHAGESKEPIAKQYLRYVYGEDGIELASIAHPSADSWMLRGPKNDDALSRLGDLKLVDKASGLVSGVIGTDLYFVETRQGLVDPAINLDGIYRLHRNLALVFVFRALSGHEDGLAPLVTDFDKLTIKGPNAPPEELGQYGAIIEQLPVVRSSKPTDDAKTRTIEYRVPLGDDFLQLKMVKDGTTWKIDTSKGLTVPLRYFFE